MRLIGYWIESVLDQNHIPPQELVGSMPADDRTLVADYLDSGEEYEAYRGHSWCRFCCGADDRTMGNRELSDGIWLWPEGLGHYVRAHGVVLPDEFVRHARAQKTPAPRFTRPDSPVDREYWKQWCRQHRSGALRERLEHAAMASIRAAEVSRAKQAAEREAELGLSTQCCQWVGCDNRALRGRAFCGLCFMKPFPAVPWEAHRNLDRVLRGEDLE